MDRPREPLGERDVDRDRNRPVRRLTLGVLVALALAVPALPAAAGEGDDQDDKGMMSWGLDRASPDGGEREGFKHFTLQAREAKRFGVGLIDGSLLGDPALGVEGFIDFLPNVQFGGTLRTTAQNLYAQADPDPLVGLTTFHGRSDELIGFARVFFGSSIYVGAGLGLRRARANWEVRELVGGREDNGQTTTIAGEVNARLGSQWAWSGGYYVSLDVADYTAPFAAGQHTDRHQPTAISHAAVAYGDQVRDKALAYGRAAAWQLLGVSAGVLF